MGQNSYIISSPCPIFSFDMNLFASVHLLFDDIVDWIHPTLDRPEFELASSRYFDSVIAFGIRDVTDGIYFEDRQVWITLDVISPMVFGSFCRNCLRQFRIERFTKSVIFGVKVFWRCQDCQMKTSIFFRLCPIFPSVLRAPVWVLRSCREAGTSFPPNMKDRRRLLSIRIPYPPFDRVVCGHR